MVAMTYGLFVYLCRGVAGWGADVTVKVTVEVTSWGEMHDG
jgi:hypothetical protein